MAFYDVNDFVRAADEQLSEYNRQGQQFNTLIADTQAKQADLQNRLQEAYRNLSEALLPELSQAAFQILAAERGLPELNRLYQIAANQSDRLSREIGQIEQSPAYINREQREYELDKQLGEVEPSYQFACRDFDELNRFPRIADLVRRQYGTPNYPHRGWLRFFNGEFLEDWRRADEICAALGVPSFPQVADRYREREEQVTVLGRTVGELQAERNAIQTLIQQRQSLLDQQATLPARVHQEAGRILATGLKNADLSGLPNPDTLKSRLTRIDGIEHQIRYLEELADKIRSDVGQLQERANKLSGERNRYASNLYRYRNKRFDRGQWDKRFNRQRIDRYEVLHNRYARSANTVYVFNDYNRVSPLEQFLWWDVITDGRIDGNFIPEVQEYHAMYPDYTYERPTRYEQNDTPFDSSNQPGFDLS